MWGFISHIDIIAIYYFVTYFSIFLFTFKSTSAFHQSYLVDHGKTLWVQVGYVFNSEGYL